MYYVTFYFYEEISSPEFPKSTKVCIILNPFITIIFEIVTKQFIFKFSFISFLYLELVNKVVILKIKSFRIYQLPDSG